MAYVSESPQQKRNRREFARFSSALTSSLASRLARRDQKASIASHNTAPYLRTANEVLRRRNYVAVIREPPIPPRFHTLLKLQIKTGKAKGQWAKSPELVELMGGFVPEAPDGVTEWRWWTALAMAFIRRHPHLHARMREAYELAEYHVPDPWLLRTARDMLPPLDGSFKDFTGSQRRGDLDPHTMAEIAAGRWQAPVKAALKQQGYMAFTWDMKGRDIRRPNEIAHLAPGDEYLKKKDLQGYDGSGADADGAASPPPTRGSGTFTADAAKQIEASIKAAGKKSIRTWRTDAEIEVQTRRDERRKKRLVERRLQDKALNMEFDAFLRRPGKSFRKNDPVTTRWRASSDWDRPRVCSQWFPAVVTKIYTDGSVDLQMMEGRCEVYRRVDKEHVRINRVELAILSAKEGAAAARAARGDGDHEEEEEEFDVFRARQERGGGPARRHEGIDDLSAKWSRGISVKSEKKRLAKYLADPRPAFSTAGLGKVDGKPLRRDRSELNEGPHGRSGWRMHGKERRRGRRQRRSLSAPSLETMIANEKANSLELALRAETPSTAGTSLSTSTVGTPTVAVGSLRNEVAMRQAKQAAHKEKRRRQRILRAVVKSEEKLALAMLKYEDQLQRVRDELKSSIEIHRTAALQTELIHAFDGVTESLNTTRWVTCELVEAIKEWRKAKTALAEMDPSLAGKNYQTMKAIEKDYDPLEDKDVDDMGNLESPGAMPFIWSGTNVLLGIETGLDFLHESAELRHWYGGNFKLLGNPFCLVTPLAERAHTPRKYTQTILLNGEEVEHEVPRLKALAGKAVRKLRACKDRQFNCSFWWPGNGIRPAQFERVRRAEKEIVQEMRREKLRNKQALKELKDAREAAATAAEAGPGF